MKDLILLVDDSPAILRVMDIGLRLHGFETVRAASGKAALELAKSASPQVMVLDVAMPEMSGFQVLEELRSFSKVPVLVCR